METYYPKIAIVLLSYNSIKKTSECIESIRRNTTPGSYELIVVDNASTDGSVQWLQQQKDIKLLCNQENVGFPRGCNQGIGMAEPESDILLLNNDTLVAKDSLENLQKCLYSGEAVAAAGSISNCATNYQDIYSAEATPDNYEKYAALVNAQTGEVYEKRIWLVGFAVMYKRTILEEIGYLDERFSPGNFEDTDIGFRIAEAGYTQLLCRNSFVFHYGNSSFGEKMRQYVELLIRNQQLFIEKWGIHPSRYSYIKKELLPFIPYKKGDEFTILDIGCGTGATMSRLQRLYPKAMITGVEIREELRRVSKTMGQIITDDITHWIDAGEAGTYDIVLAGGVFEYQENIQGFLQRLKKVLSPRGRMVGTIYNRDFPGLHPEEGKTYYTAEELVYAAVCQNYDVENIQYIVQNGQQYEYVFVLKPKS